MKKSVLICLAGLSLSLLLVFVSYAGEPAWTYNQLATKDLNQMNQLVKDALKKAKDGEGVDNEALRDITRTIFTRANRDRMIEKVFPDVRTQLEDAEILETTFGELVTEAINGLKREETKPSVQVSHLIFLENFLAEHKPVLGEEWVKKLFEQIRDAKIEISSKAESERKLNLMQENKSPSEIAKTLLNKHAEKKKP